MLNKVLLIGNLGKDPVVKHFSNDNAIAEFPLATNETYKDREGNLVKQTEWHNIKIPTKRQAEIAEKYLRKGSMVFVEGKIKTRTYDDKDGNKRYVTEIIAETFRMMDKRPDGSNENSGSTTGNTYNTNTNPGPDFEPAGPTPTIGDDLPF